MNVRTDRYRELFRTVTRGQSRTPRPYGRQGLWFHAWIYPFTPAGKLLIVGIGCSTFAGAFSAQVPIFRLCTTLIGLAVVSAMTGSLLRWSRVRITGRLPEKVSAGQTVSGVYTISNQGRMPAYDVSLGCFLLPRSWKSVPDAQMVPCLIQGQSVRQTIKFIPLQRGLYRLPAIRAFTTFPFNLFRNELSRDMPGTILVRPSFHPITRLSLDGGNRYQPGGIALTSHIGESPEYIGNRDYVPGDTPRKIDFRSWARLAKPVVKEYQEEYYNRIALVLDSYVVPGRRPKREGFPDLEAAVSLSAAIADALARGDYILDIFAAGPELYVFRTGRHTAHFENVLEILACVGPCRDDPFSKLAPALVDELIHISTLFCVFLDWDEPRRDLVRAALEAGCSVKVLIVRDGKTSLPAIESGPVRITQYTPAQIRAGGADSL